MGLLDITVELNILVFKNIVLFLIGLDKSKFISLKSLKKIISSIISLK